MVRLFQANLTIPISDHDKKLHVYHLFDELSQIVHNSGKYYVTQRNAESWRR